MNVKFVSLGSNCYVSMALRKSGFQNKSYPFDWINTFRFREELQFMKDLEENPKILMEMPASTLKVDTEGQNSHLKSYYLDRYKIRLPHEHEINPNITDQEIIEKYDRRYKRLIEDCKKSDHVVFIRTIAYKCYELDGENDNDYDRILIQEFVNYLRIICGHENFTLLILSQRGTFKNPLIENTVAARLSIPFENTAFIADPNLPTGEEAVSFFKRAFENISKASNHSEIIELLQYPFEI